MKIAVCVDGSEQADKAFQEALKYRKADDDFYVLASFEYVDPASGILPGFADAALADNERKKTQAHSILEKYKQLCLDQKVPAHMFALGATNVKDGLVDKIEELGVDMVVVGNRGLGAVKRLFFGSVSNYIVHHVKCDVLVVK